MEKTEKKRRIIVPVLTALLILAAIGFGVVYKKYTDVKNNPEKVAQAEIADIVQKAGKIISLPKDETPILATVSDSDKLKDQPFFAEAKNDDKLLIYTKAKKAILYRPSSNMVVNVGPLVMNTSDVPAPEDQFDDQ